MNQKKKSGTEKRKPADANTGKPPAISRGLPEELEKVVGSPNSGIPIVGIGASAGGLEALEEFFGSMPIDSGLAFVVVTHQHPGHTSMLPELLGRKTKMPVGEAVDGLKVQPNHIYVGPPGGHLEILNGALFTMETGKQTSPKLPIDHFFRSLAEDQKEKAICIILSGTGTDGTLGLRAIKEELGMAMVEQPQAAKYSGMPSSAIATGLADYVLSPAEMPKHLVAFAKGPYLQGAAVAAEHPGIPPEPMQKIFLLLRGRTGNDFSSYKSNTLRRRIERRMNVHQILGPNQYVRHLQENPHEIDILFRELLISVTSFFRDPDAWKALAGHVAGLLATRPENHIVRVWVPGCATGEEVYSLGILVRECMESATRQHEVQIFGTDLDAQAIETARSGRYPDGIAGDISAERLKRFFMHSDSSFRVSKEIREMAIFATQNVIRDPPFTKLDLISCRNLLIYLNSEIQKKLLPVFHYALKPGGLLFLGPSETIGSFTDLFEPVDKRWKIFRRKECATAAIVLPEIPVQSVSSDESETRATMEKQTGREPGLATVLERLLLARFAPASVVVNDRADIVYIHGRTGAYLEPSQGKPRSNLLEMAREGLSMELTAAIRQCAKDGVDVVRERVRIRSNGDFLEIGLTVTRLDSPASVRGLLLVTFRPTVPTSSDSIAGGKARSGSRKKADHHAATAHLERELQHIREVHQTTLEELETSNEELKSANEELQSTNEELQSTNEELETSKEEMQSLNEELTTVNVELQSKVDDLSQSNDDMQNLLDSTDIATVFLDSQLNIRRFTEHARNLVMLRRSDVGRPIHELASNLESNSLVADCREVLKTLAARESEVLTRNGDTYLMRVMPYRTTSNVIDGLVITFVHIGHLKKAQKLGELRAFFESIVATVRQPLLVLDESNRVVSANRNFLDTFRLRLEKVEGKSLYEIGDGEWDIPELRELVGEVLPNNRAFDGFRMEHNFPRIGTRTFLLNARRLEQQHGLPGMILLAMEDVTGQESRGIPDGQKEQNG